MPKKKKLPINWEDIKTRRTVLGQSWADIMDVYDVALSSLKNRASKEGWQAAAAKIDQEVATRATEMIIQSKAAGLASLQDKINRLQDLTIDVHLEFMTNLKSQIKDIQNPYLFDGERTNSLFQTAMNNAVKVLLASIKTSDDSSEEEEAPGFNVSLDSDVP